MQKFINLGVIFEKLRDYEKVFHFFEKKILIKIILLIKFNN